MKYFPKRSNCLCYCRRWNCFVVMLMIGLRLDLIVNLTWRVAAVVDELERWRLLLYCRCYSYYLQFVPECPMHTLNTNRDSMATARDSQRALYTTDIEVLPPLHEHSTLLPRFSSKCSLNSLSLIYFRLSHWITHTKPNQPTKFFCECFVFSGRTKFFRSCKYLLWNFQRHICHSVCICFLLFTIICTHSTLNGGGGGGGCVCYCHCGLCLVCNSFFLSCVWTLCRILFYCFAMATRASTWVRSSSKIFQTFQYLWWNVKINAKNPLWCICSCLWSLVYLCVCAYPFHTIHILYWNGYSNPSATKRIYFNSFDKQICMPKCICLPISLSNTTHQFYREPSMRL